jgi:hypothetical protein
MRMDGEHNVPPEKESAMRRAGVCPAVFGLAMAVLALAALVLPLSTASAGSADGKRPSGRHWHGYGFLPGYEPPDVVEWRRNFRPGYWYGGPRFYRGRWNGGGFGPCWTQTPIGPHWNCG